MTKITLTPHDKRRLIEAKRLIDDALAVDTTEFFPPWNKLTQAREIINSVVDSLVFRTQ